HLAGQGVDHLITHALGPDHADLFDRCGAIYLAHYDEHKYDRSGPFPGIAELLDALVDKGVRMAVLSNKHDPAAQEMMRVLFGRWRFDAVRGAVRGVPLKPDPAGALAIAGDLDIPPAQWLYV